MLSTIVLNIKYNFINTYFICLFHGLNAFNPFCWEDSYFVLLSLIRTLDLRSKVLPFGFSQINLENLSLIRTFANVIRGAWPILALLRIYPQMI